MPVLCSLNPLTVPLGPVGGRRSGRPRALRALHCSLRNLSQGKGATMHACRDPVPRNFFLGSGRFETNPPERQCHYDPMNTWYYSGLPGFRKRRVLARFSLLKWLVIASPVVLTYLHVNVLSISLPCFRESRALSYVLSRMPPALCA